MAVRITPEAEADLGRLPVTIRARVADVVDRLEKWPHVSGAKPLRGEWAGHYRIRTGDWRVVFRAKGSTVVLVRIMNRVDVYER